MKGSTISINKKDRHSIFFLLLLKPGVAHPPGPDPLWPEQHMSSEPWNRGGCWWCCSRGNRFQPRRIPRGPANFPFTVQNIFFNVLLPLTQDNVANMVKIQLVLMCWVEAREAQPTCDLKACRHTTHTLTHTQHGKNSEQIRN